MLRSTIPVFCENSAGTGEADEVVAGSETEMKRSHHILGRQEPRCRIFGHGLMASRRHPIEAPQRLGIAAPERRDATALRCFLRRATLMDTVAIAGQKGGTGKTTTAVNLAVAAQPRLTAVVVLPVPPFCPAMATVSISVALRKRGLWLDPQGSLAAWAARREVDDPAVDHLGLERVEQLPKIDQLLRHRALTGEIGRGA
jgi:hypothetical protein